MRQADLSGEAVTIEQERNRALLGWFATNGRSLPWRGTRDPYVILVSEVMLQQTQVDRVIPFFERFLEQFPTVETLAAAPLRQVLTVWSGLGYNSRAHRLHQAAAEITKSGWPSGVRELAALPGVGPYTARALASFSLGLDVVPVDTNIRRVLSRWHGEPLEGAILQTIAEADAGETDPSAWTQAVMDLGSALCRPRSPRCDACPVSSWCAGPDVYVPPHPQSRFEGSDRQLRGAIIRRLVTSPTTPEQLSATTGFPLTTVRSALDNLESEGLVEASGKHFRLPE